MHGEKCSTQHDRHDRRDILVPHRNGVNLLKSEVRKPRLSANVRKYLKPDDAEP